MSTFFLLQIQGFVREHIQQPCRPSTQFLQLRQAECKFIFIFVLFRWRPPVGQTHQLGLPGENAFALQHEVPCCVPSSTFRPHIHRGHIATFGIPFLRSRCCVPTLSQFGCNDLEQSPTIILVRQIDNRCVIVHILKLFNQCSLERFFPQPLDHILNSYAGHGNP